MTNNFDLFYFVKEEPVLTLLIVLLAFLLCIHSYLNTKISSLQKHHKPHRPKLSISSSKKANGIIMGRKGKKIYYSPITDECHIFCCASSGAGKTSALAIPSIRSACKNTKTGTCFCIDISGDISNNCNIPNKLIFDIDDPKTSPYYIFASIDEEPQYQLKNELLEKLAYLIMPDIKITSDAGIFFQKNGRNMLTGALIAYYHQGLDFVPMCKKILSMDYQSLLYDIVNTGNEDAIRYISSFSGANEKNSAGCKQEMDSFIKLFATNFRMEYAIRRPKSKDESYISPQQLRDSNIFLRIPDAKTDLYGPLLGICTAQAFDYCASRKNNESPTILFVLDEFASLRIGSSDILNAVRKYRKKNVRLMILTQALIDLDILYGTQTREAIMNNIKYKVILGITDPQSQRYFSDIVGQHEVQTTSISMHDNSTSTSYSTKKEFIIPPEAFGQLRDDLYVICDDGSHIKLSKNYYFKYNT